MKQAIFVLQEGKVCFWTVTRGVLQRRSLDGFSWIPFTESYWSSWKEANQVADEGGVDAILLSDQVGAFGRIPEFLKTQIPSAWNIDLLASLAKQRDFTGASICLNGWRCQLLVGTTLPDRELTFEFLSTSNFDLPVGRTDLRQDMLPAMRCLGIDGLSEKERKTYYRAVLAAARMGPNREKQGVEECLEEISDKLGLPKKERRGNEFLSYIDNPDELIGKFQLTLPNDDVRETFLEDCENVYLEGGGDTGTWQNFLKRALKGWDIPVERQGVPVVLSQIDENARKVYFQGIVMSARLGSRKDGGEFLNELIEGSSCLMPSQRILGYSLAEVPEILFNSYENDSCSYEFIGQCASALRDEELQLLFWADCTRVYKENGGELDEWQEKFDELNMEMAEERRKCFMVFFDVVQNEMCSEEQRKVLGDCFDQQEIKYLLGDYIRDFEISYLKLGFSDEERNEMFKALVLDAFVPAREEEGYVDIGRRTVKCQLPTYGSDRYLQSYVCETILGENENTVVFGGHPERCNWSWDMVLDLLRVEYKFVYSEISDSPCDCMEKVVTILMMELEHLLSQIDQDIAGASSNDGIWKGWRELDDVRLAHFNELFEAIRTCFSLGGDDQSPSLVVEQNVSDHEIFFGKFSKPHWKVFQYSEEEADFMGCSYALITPDIVITSNCISWNSSCASESQVKKVASAFLRKLPDWLADEIRLRIN